MDILRNWILSVCGATVIVSVAKFFSENSTLKKSFNTFLATFLIFYTIVPLREINIDSIDLTTFEDNDKHEEYALEGYNKIVHKSIHNICIENNVKVLDFNIDSYINNDGIMCIKYLIIDIDDNDKKDIVKKEIMTKTGFEVIVEWNMISSLRK